MVPRMLKKDYDCLILIQGFKGLFLSQEQTTNFLYIKAINTFCFASFRMKIETSFTINLVYSHLIISCILFCFDS